MWLRTGPELFMSREAYKKLTLGLHINPWASSYGARCNWAQGLPWEMFLPLSYPSKPDRAKKRRNSGMHMRQIASQRPFLKILSPYNLLKLWISTYEHEGCHVFLWFIYLCDKWLLSTYLMLKGLCEIGAENLHSPRSVAHLYYLTMFFSFSGFCKGIYAYM